MMGFPYFLILLLFASGLCRPENQDGEEDQNDAENPEEETPADQEAPKVIPAFLTANQTITAQKGDLVRLPCDIKDLGDVQVMWLNGSQQLFIGSYKWDGNNQRVSISGTTLQISDVSAADSNIYTCKLLISEHLRPSISHRLQVKIPAAIKSIEPSGRKEIRKGNDLHLKCEATGSPVPEVKWIHHRHRKDPKESVEHKGSEHFILKVDRTDSGVYECIAENELSGNNPPKASVEIDVLFEPEISVKDDIINSAENIESELICIVHGHPTPKVTWFKESYGDVNEISDGPDYKVSNKGNLHILNFKIKDAKDFGNYSCRAQNEFGSLEKKIAVFGVPLTPTIIEVTNSTENPWSKLRWQIVSTSPILEYEVKYWKKTSPSKHSSENVPVENAVVSSNVYQLEHFIKNLASVGYEAVLRARNQYGWSKYSKPQIFSGVQNGPFVPDVLENKGGASAGVASTISVLALLVTLVASLHC